MRNLFRKFLRKRKKQPYIFSGMEPLSSNPEDLIFCTGMGRSGTHFLARLIELNKDVSAYHLDEIGNPIADSFYQFAKWYNIDLDPGPLFASRAYLASKAGAEGKKYFESNPYLNLHVTDLAKHFDCKILIIYRDPQKVIESHYNKGWYLDYQPQFDAENYSVPGYQYNLEGAHYFFGRFFPGQKEEFEEWLNYTRVGKISWMWATVYNKILQDIAELDCCCLVRTDALDYEKYKELCDFMEIKKNDARNFDNVLNQKPGKGSYINKPEWNSIESNEFEKQTNDVFSALKKHPQNI